jgi:hypothetical protein
MTLTLFSSFYVLFRAFSVFKSKIKLSFSFFWKRIKAKKKKNTNVWNSWILSSGGKETAYKKYMERIGYISTMVPVHFYVTCKDKLKTLWRLRFVLLYPLPHITLPCPDVPKTKKKAKIFVEFIILICFWRHKKWIIWFHRLSIFGKGFYVI